MLNLAQHALLEFSKHNKCDCEHPVIMDQIFDTEMNRMTTQRQINGLKSKITKLKHKVHAMSNLQLIDINIRQNIIVSNRIAHELFTVFNWTKIHNKQQSSWKEYFHMMYDLLVSDYDNDHSGNIILARSVVKYHNVLVVPELIHCNDRMYPIISSINDLFQKLKEEQVVIYKSLKNIKVVIQDIQERVTSVQHEIITLQQELKMAEADNKKYFQLIQWSVR